MLSRLIILSYILEHLFWQAHISLLSYLAILMLYSSPVHIPSEMYPCWQSLWVKLARHTSLKLGLSRPTLILARSVMISFRNPPNTKTNIKAIVLKIKNTKRRLDLNSDYVSKNFNRVSKVIWNCIGVQCPLNPFQPNISLHILELLSIHFLMCWQEEFV